MSASVTTGDCPDGRNAVASRRRYSQFGLRTLLIAISVLAAFLGFWRAYVLSYRAETATIDRIKALNTPGISDKFQIFTEPRGQYFLRQLFGEKLSHRAVYVHLLSDEVTDAWLRDNITGLSHTEGLTIKSQNVTDAGIEHLKSLTNLTELGLPTTQVTDAGMEELKRALPKLKRVWR